MDGAAHGWKNPRVYNARWLEATLDNYDELTPPVEIGKPTMVIAPHENQTIVYCKVARNPR